MNIRKLVHRPFLLLGVIALPVTSSLAAEKAKPKPDAAREAALRQKEKGGEQLEVYVKGKYGAYVQGKQLSPKSLSKVARKVKAEAATITTGPDATRENVEKVKAALQKAGIQKVRVTAYRPPQKKKPAKGKKADKANDKRGKDKEKKGGAKCVVTEVLERQKEKGDELGVYLRDASRVYVSGKQLSLESLVKVASRSKTGQAAISAEKAVPRERLDEISQLLKKAGIQSIRRARPK